MNETKYITTAPPAEPEPTKEQQARERLLNRFRAHLSLAITAKQAGREKEFKARRGPKALDYCRELATLPDNTLAAELAAPLTASLNQIFEVATSCEANLRRQDEQSAAWQASSQRVLAQVDLALALMLRQAGFINRRAGQTECDQLLGEVLGGMMTGNGEVADLVRRWHEKFPEEAEAEDGGIPDAFAWDVYERVAALDRLADDFPDAIRPAARRMRAWPMLTHRHTNSRRRFEELAKRLELGAEYPLDAGENAQFDPDAALVRYLDGLLHRLLVTCRETRGMTFKSVKEEARFLYQLWWTRREDMPDEAVLEVIHAARKLPPLTKATAAQWAELAVVPLILATEGRDFKECKEPGLREIVKQKGVTSAATFKARLGAAVTAALEGLAREG